MSNITSCDSGSFSTENTREDAAKQQPEMLCQFHSPHSHTSTTTTNNSNGSNTNSQPSAPVKKKRSLPGNPDPSAEVIALSPTTLMATNRFMCEICNKGFQRDQNLQLHRRGHNLPWKLKQRTSTEIRKRVYVCPEPSCVHHNPARALGDLTGIKKHFCRKHGEKKWKCDKCSKKYAVQSDWKAHSKICGTREYKCDCGTIFSRRDSFITHRAFCDALAEENNKGNNEGQQLPKMGSNMQCQPIPNLVISCLPMINTNTNLPNPQISATSEFNPSDLKHPLPLPHELMPMPPAPKPFNMAGTMFTTRGLSSNPSPSLQLSSNNMFDQENGLHCPISPHMSATALLQKAAQMGATVNEKTFATNMAPPSFATMVQQQQQSFMNQFIQSSSQQDININMSSQYNNNNNNFTASNGSSMNGVDMFNAILDQSKALSKIMEQNSRSNSGSGATNNGGSSSGAVKGSGGDVMTLDLLGIGGGGGGGHGNFFGGVQQAETATPDEVWRNWSNKNAGFESFSATSSI
ncbi:hypothetical protein RJT34_22962 [Clitoria ternatea]|uniref:C2H2-type domain-containing protein n=1 Tax=Clitoria ternatea TaxID=43366 RepID=A0AAN9IG26_CLITE